jgi:hypothetical protein
MPQRNLFFIAFVSWILLVALITPVIAMDGEKSASSSSTKLGARQTADVKRQDLEILESWVNELNDSVKVIWEYQNSSKLVLDNIHLSERLVYGIDEKIKDLSRYALSAAEKTRLANAMDNMTHQAAFFYQQHSLDEIRKRQKTDLFQKKAEPISRSEKAPVLLESSSEAELDKVDEHSKIPAYMSALNGNPTNGRTYALSVEDLKYGQVQVQRMLTDRPEMARYIRKGDAIWNWCSRQYAGECTGSKYFWSPNEEDNDGLIGWHSVPYLGRPGSVTVGQKYNMSRDGEKLWSVAIFELFNLRNDATFLAWDRHASFSKINQHERVKQCVWLEYETTKQLTQFYKKYWMPHSKRLHLNNTHAWYWYVGIPTTFDEWFKKMPKDSQYLKHYGGY